MVPLFSFGKWNWVQKGLKFSFSRFGHGFSLFLAKQVWGSSFLERFECVKSLVLVVQVYKFEVQPVVSKFIILGFDTTLFYISHYTLCYICYQRDWCFVIHLLSFLFMSWESESSFHKKKYFGNLMVASNEFKQVLFVVLLHSCFIKTNFAKLNHE